MTKELPKKVAWCYRLLDTCYLIRSESITDQSIRIYMRMFFIQVDNLLKYLGELKNELFKDGKITLEERRELESKIRVLSTDYDNSFDIIRDKLAAHNQDIEFEKLIDWWSSIDHSVIELIYSDAKEIQSILESAGVTFMPVPDYSPITGNGAQPQEEFKISTDRLAFAKRNTSGMLACHPSQEKAQTITSILEFLDADFRLTYLSDNPDTIYKRLVFDVGWMLVILDTCSLLDNLFVSSPNEKCLLDHWLENDFGGYHSLAQMNSNRNLEYEKCIREIRNQFAAHIDKKSSFEELYSRFENLNLNDLYSYVTNIVNLFNNACRQDVRSSTILINNTTLKGVIGLAYDNSNDFFC